MSKVKIEGNASGTGTFTIAAPNSNTDYSLTLPETTGGEFVVTDSSGNVGIGTSPNTNFVVLKNGSLATHPGVADFTASFQNTDNTSEDAIVGITSSTSGSAKIHFGDTGNVNVGVIDYDNSDNSMRFSTSASERMRIDSSGNLLVGKTAASSTTIGAYLQPDGAIVGTRSSANPLLLNRTTSNGDIAVFRKDGSNVGTIGTGPGGGDFFKVIGAKNYFDAGVGNTGLRFYEGVRRIYPINTDTNAEADNAIDLGSPTSRFDDIYATNGTIQTSDRNEKQDIEELSEAETRAAISAKGLLKKFRWKDAVAEKGDEARIHFGIIAQELQAAFEAEGLDAGRYAMFIHSTWWETYTDVPAVEAVDAVYETQTDEEGNEVQVLVSEAVEAKEAYTRTDTYHSAEEAPEGAVEKSRMGVRYSELLAFIIAAL
jgi:hypothetical protein